MSKYDTKAMLAWLNQAEIWGEDGSLNPVEMYDAITACILAVGELEDPAAALRAAREYLQQISKLAAIRGDGTCQCSAAWSVVYDECTAALAALGAEAKHGS